MRCTAIRGGPRCPGVRARHDQPHAADEALQGCGPRSTTHSARHSALQCRSGSDRCGRHLPAQWSNVHSQQCVLPESRDQWKNLLQLPPAARWLDRQRSRCCRALCGKRRHRPDLPAGRRRHVPERRCLDLRRQTTGLQTADRQGFDQDRPADPGGAQFAVTAVDDPYNCNTNPVTGLTSTTTGIVSTYRRPLPSTNLGFLSAIMWDGREPSLSSQATDATLGPRAGQYAAHRRAGGRDRRIRKRHIRRPSLRRSGGQPGRRRQHRRSGCTVAATAEFLHRRERSAGTESAPVPFTSQIFDLYRPWLACRASATVAPDVNRSRAARRCSTIPTSTSLTFRASTTISASRAFRDSAAPATTRPTWATTRSRRRSTSAFPTPVEKPPVLDISGLPVFTLTCTQGPLAGQIYKVTDAGKAMISGQCKDIGRFKGPFCVGLRRGLRISITARLRRSWTS